MEEIISNLLKGNGYQLLEDTTAIAMRIHNTVVGEKEEHIYLSNSDGYNRSLTSSYFSAGDVKTYTLLPIDKSEEEIKALVLDFIKDAQDKISKSYANKLTN